MTDLRLMKHPDGRVALSILPDIWFLIVNGVMFSIVDDSTILGEAGFNKLYITQLPSPDRFIECEGNDHQPATTPQWTRSGLTVTAWTEGIEINDCGLTECLEEAADQSLVILAAIEASKRFRKMWTEGREKENS